MQRQLFSSILLGVAAFVVLSFGSCQDCFNCDCPVTVIVNGQEVPGGTKEVETCDHDEWRSWEDEGCSCEKL